MRHILNIGSARRVHEKDWRSSGIPFYRAREIGKLAEYGHVDNDLFIDQELYDDFSQSGVPLSGDLMVTAVGTLGKVYVVHDNEVFYYKDGSVLCLGNTFNLNSNFLKLAIESPFFITQYQNESQGTTVATLTMVRMNEYLLPIPPIAEQQRVVSMIEDIMPSINRYEKSQEALDKLNAEIFEKLKKSVLQEAIQGKLVPQDPNDEPASILLERIKAEKARLFKEGRLKKKDITDSVIFKGEDNKYYEQIDSEVYEIETEMRFPTSWELVRLGDICRLVDGEKRSGAYPCLDAKYLRGKSAATILQTGKFVQAGDNIILVDGENSGEVFSIPVNGYMGSTFKQLWISSELHLPYILHFILFYKEQLRNSKKGAAIPHLNKEIFYNLLVGIPPLKEQYRISESVANLFSKLS